MAYQFGEIIFDKYRIEKQISGGTFCEVYLATHLKLDMPRVVKLIRRDAITLSDSDSQEIRQQFQQEAQIGARINHPALIRVFDFDESIDLMSIAMEYASGGSLLSMLSDKKMSSGSSGKAGLEIPRFIEIAGQVAEGLAAIHALDIVHRDLKPSNILFDAAGQAKISDLGLAQIKDGKSHRSHSNRLNIRNPHPGTPAYMSPEQESSNKYLSTASDVYSFGLILFEMLSGRLYKSLRPGTRIRDLRQDTPLWLDELVSKTLSEHPEQRPWSGEELCKIFAEHAVNKSAPVTQSKVVAPIAPVKNEIPAFPIQEPIKPVERIAASLDKGGNQRNFKEFLQNNRLYLIIGALIISVIIIVLIFTTNTRADSQKASFASGRAAAASGPASKSKAITVPTIDAAEKANQTILGRWSVTRVIGFPPKGRPWQDAGNILEFRSDGLMKSVTYEGYNNGETSYRLDGNKVTFKYDDGHLDTWLLTFYEFKDTMQLNKEGTEEMMDLSRVQ